MKIRVLTAMAGAAITVQAGHVECSDEKTVPVQVSALTVLVYDYAGLAEWATRNLEQRTGQIMSHVGIRLEWVRCRGSRAALRQESCPANTGPGRIVFRVLAHCSEGASRHGDVLGFALTPGSYASICADQVLKIEKDNWMDRGSVMPYAAAHEIGHLLLGPVHGGQGIMRAVWGKAELAAMERLMLTFSEGEAEAMRGAVSAALTPAAPH